MFDVDNRWSSRGECANNAICLCGMAILDDDERPRLCTNAGISRLLAGDGSYRHTSLCCSAMQVSHLECSLPKVSSTGAAAAKPAATKYPHGGHTDLAPLSSPTDESCAAQPMARSLTSGSTMSPSSTQT
jgi:hypothetical protein